MMKINRLVRSLLKRFSGNNDGVAAVEFALLLPLFLVIYICVIEFTQAFMVQRRAHHSAAMLADIVAQSNTVTTAQLSDFFAIGGLIMAPYSSTPLTGRVTSVVMNAQKQPRVQWSYGSNMPVHKVNAVLTIPQDLLKNEGDSLIFAETVYSYDSPFDIAVPGFPDYLSNITTFRREFYLRPREVASVTCTNCPTS